MCRQMRKRNSGVIIYTSSRAAVAVSSSSVLHITKINYISGPFMDHSIRRRQNRNHPVCRMLTERTQRDAEDRVRFRGEWYATHNDRRLIKAHDVTGISLFSIHPGEIETQLHTTGFPEKTHKEAPYIIEHMKALDAKRPHFDASLPAYTCVFLATGKAAKLRGRYVDCTRDINEAIALYT